MNEKLQKVIARINQLRAISKSTHSRAEAETTLQLAAKLIAQYQLDEATIETETGKVEDPLDLDGEHIIYESGRIVQWKSELAIGVAELNGLYLYNARVRGRESHRYQTRYRIIGKKSNIAIGLYMFEFLVATIQELVNDYVPGTTGKRGVNPDREQWCLGCVRGFLDKMKAEKREVMKQATSTALVFVGNQAKEAEDAFKKKTGIKLVASSYRPQGQTRDTYGSGYKKGQTITVNAGMSGGAKEPNKLT